jgi:hypothetical protein
MEKIYPAQYREIAGLYPLDRGNARIIGVSSSGCHMELVSTGEMINIQLSGLQGLMRLPDPHPHPFFHALLKNPLYNPHKNIYIYTHNNQHIRDALVDSPGTATYYIFRSILEQTRQIQGPGEIRVMRDQFVTRDMIIRLSNTFSTDLRNQPTRFMLSGGSESPLATWSVGDIGVVEVKDWYY